MSRLYLLLLFRFVRILKVQQSYPNIKITPSGIIGALSIEIQYILLLCVIIHNHTVDFKALLDANKLNEEMVARYLNRRVN